MKSQSQVAIKADTRIIARSFDSSDRGPESQIVLTDWSAPRRVDFLISGEPLVISEVNYHPQPPTSSEIAAGHDEADDFEFIEIVNTTSFTQELSDLQLVQVGRDGNQDGVVFDFSKGIISTIQPNQRIVVVEDLDAFKFRYGDDFPVAGQWSGGLSNSSEMISLYSGDRKVQQFTYDDSWYPETDGVGKTLEIINGRNSNLESWSLRESWRPSALIGGTPGNPMLSDFNSDHTLSAIDIELLFSAIRTGSNDPRFDLNQDQTVDQLDRDLWLKIFGTGFGDTDLDGSFNSRDLVQIFVAGEYEDAIIGNSTWEEGDWDGDGEFSSSDLVLAFQNGYEFG